MKLNKSQEELLRQSLREAFEVRQAELLRNDTSPPLSPDFKDRLKAELAKGSPPPKQIVPPVRHQQTFPLRYWVAAVLVLVTLLGCGTVMACPSLWDRVVCFFTKEDTQRGNTHFTAVVEGEERRAFDISTYYTLSGVPEDFVPIVSREGPRNVFRLWLKSGSASGAETYILFEQIPLNSLCILSTEGCTEETVTLHGHEATLYTKPSEQTLVWYTEDCMFVLGFWGKDTQKLDVLALADDILLNKSQSPLPLVV